MKISANIEFRNQNPLKSNHWNIIFLYLYFRKNINLGSLYLKISYCCDARCSFTSFSLKFSHFLKISVEFGQNASIILKIDTVSTQSTNCNSEKIRPIPPRTNRHGVSYQLLSPPLGVLTYISLILFLMVNFGKYNLTKLYNSFSNIRRVMGGKRFSYSQRGKKKKKKFV